MKYRAYIEFIYDESELPDYPASDKLFSAQNVTYEKIMELVDSDSLQVFDLIKVEEIN